MLVDFLDIAERVNKDSCIPASVPVGTIAFLHHLNNTCGGSDHPLYRFLVSECVRDSFVDQVVASVVLPDAVGMLQEIDSIQQSIENAVAAQDFPLAKKLLDQRRSLEVQLREQRQVEISPEHIIDAIRRLGYDGEIPR